MFHNLHSAYRVNSINIAKCKILYKNISKAVVKTSENDCCCKSESRVLHKWLKSYMTKQLLTSISEDIRIYLPSKVIFTSALRPL